MEGSDRKTALKELIRRLHQGADVEDVKRRFSEVLGNATPEEIARIEDELIKEGMSQEEIHRLCDVHLAVFKEGLEKEKTLAPEGHPIYILMEEHRVLLDFTQKLNTLAEAMAGKSSLEKEDEARLKNIVKHFKESELHYLREENVLFPYLEKHGITGPPAIMWSEHDKIRGIKKDFYTLMEKSKGMDFGDFARLLEIAHSLKEMLQSHFYKENNILFPTSLKVIEDIEWEEIRGQFDEIGYCCFTPGVARITMEGKESKEGEVKEGIIDFKTGSFSKEELETLLNTLPVDITYVDTNDRVRYFSQGKDRIFVRAKAVIGRKVQQCHPGKSIHVVQKILDDFRAKKRDAAEFWIEIGGKFVYIRYFAIRNGNGKYLGCLEVTQDVANIRKLQGEKRLLE